MSYTDVEPKVLNDLFTYEQESGRLFWKSRPISHFCSAGSCTTWNKRFSGKEVGTIHKSNKSSTHYRITKLLGNMTLVHLIIWAMVYGEWPSLSIDHKDRNGLNNKLDNLVEATQEDQLKNRGISRANTSGTKGVSWHKLTGKWQARISVDKKEITLGLFSDFDEAVATRIEAEKKYGYAPQEIL